MIFNSPNRPSEAIKCHERALVGADPAVSVLTTLSTLAKLHAKTGDTPAAATAHRRLLATAAASGAGPGEMIKSWLFLAKVELAGVEGDGTVGNWSLAAQYLQNIVVHVSFFFFGLSVLWFLF